MTREVPQCLLLLYESKEWQKKGTRRPTEMAKNTQIFIKRSSVGHFGLVTSKKYAVFKALFESDRVIAPKPLKLRHKSDFLRFVGGYKIEVVI